MQPRRTGWSGKILVLLGATCSMAWAQHVWVDEKGIKQYSDKPPPASVPRERILKPAPKPVASLIQSAPARSAAADAPATPAGPASPAASAGGKAPPTLADRNADFNKRRAEQAEKDKKIREQEKLAQDKAKNCERAASYKRSLESGARITRVDSKGEPAFLTDAQRADDIREAQKMLEGCP